MKRFFCALLAAAMLMGCCPALAEDAAPAAEGEYEVPEVIQEAIRIGIAEWEEVGEKSLTQKKKDNKYIKWWGYEDIGWCGAFVGYCMDTAGVPMLPEDDCNRKSVASQVEGVIPYSTRAAGVPKIYTGFNNMGRVSEIPRPGYLIVYGARDYYDFVHVGLVTDVIDRGDGVYQLFTVEGNVPTKTVKRFSFLYDSTAKPDRNLSLLPEEEWAEPEIYHYEGPRQTQIDGKKYPWFVKGFCQTWQ